MDPEHRTPDNPSAPDTPDAPTAPHQSPTQDTPHESSLRGELNESPAQDTPHEPSAQDTPHESPLRGELSEEHSPRASAPAGAQRAVGGDATPAHAVVMQSPPPDEPSPRRSSRFTDGPLPMILGTLLAVVLGFVLTRDDARISRLEDKVDAGFAAQDAKFDARISRLEDKVDAKIDDLEDKVDAGFAAQDAKIDEISLKLTALIAALNATAQVDAALGGSLLDPNAAPSG